MEEDKRLQLAKRNAYALLRERPRSEAEMRRRLGMKGYGGETAEAVIASLKKSGMIDDAKFARLWVESRMHANPAGDAVLKYELKEKGVSDDIIESVLAEKTGLYDEYDLVMKIAGERFEQMKKIDRRKALKRVYDFLIRRGFRYDIIRRVIEELPGR